MKYNSKVQKLWNEASELSSDCPVEDEVQDSPDFSVDLEEGTGSETLKAIDFVVANPNFVAVKDDPEQPIFVHLFKTENAAVSKLKSLIEKATKTPKYHD